MRGRLEELLLAKDLDVQKFKNNRTHKGTSLDPDADADEAKYILDVQNFIQSTFMKVLVSFLHVANVQVAPFCCFHEARAFLAVVAVHIATASTKKLHHFCVVLITCDDQGCPLASCSYLLYSIRIYL